MIGIVGGGLAGLTCATALARAGRDFRLFEAGPVVGGKVRSARRDGFTLDRGFQVFLDSYPSLRAHAKISALEPRYFDSGALLWDRGKVWTLRNPLKHPAGGFGALASDPFPAADKARLAKLAAGCVAVPDAAHLAATGRSDDRSILASVRAAGLTPECIERLVRPFFGGVFLDNELESSAALFGYYLKKFALGRAFVPAGGVGTLPSHLATRAGVEKIETGVRVSKFLADQTGAVRALEAGDGRCFDVEAVVLACDAEESARLLGVPSPDLPRRPVWTLWFAASESLYRGRLIVLPAGHRRLVRHFVQITNIAPEYSANKRPLIVATVIEPQGLPSAALAAEAKREIAEVFRAARGGLETVEILRIDKAVFREPPGFLAHRPAWKLPPNVHLAGEVAGWSCIESAMGSGAQAAKALTKK